MSFKKEFKSIWNNLTWVGKPLIVVWCMGYGVCALSEGADKVLPKIGDWFCKLIFKE